MVRKDKKSTKNQSKYECELCDDRDKHKPLVACDVCDKWYHFACVNLVSIGKKDTWICPKCIKPSNTKKQSTTYSCELCLDADNDKMFECNQCSRKFHFVCLEIDPKEIPKHFLCADCYNLKWRKMTASSGLQQELTSSRSAKEPININRSTDRTNVRELSDRQLQDQDSPSIVLKKRQQLELEFLDAQREMHDRWVQEKEIREQEYLLKRYEILKESISESKVQQTQRNNDWVSNHIRSQQQKDTVKSQHEDEDIDMKDFLERLKKLKCTDDVSQVKPQMNAEKEESAKIQPLLTSKGQNSQQFVYATNQQGDHINQVHSQLIHSMNVPSVTKSLPKAVNASEPEHVLTKNQIASRHVVKSTLKNFNGDPLEWTSWFNSYNTSTELCGYSDGENLLRLQGCLKGVAERAVKHRLLSPSQVPSIISTLKMLYGRPELIVNALLKTIKEITPPKADKLETLVDYAMEVNNVSATIESAELHYHLSNPSLIYELVEKLPIHTKIDWAKFKATKQDITLKDLADWLYNLASVVCTVTVPTTPKPDSNSDKKSKKGFERVNVHQAENEQTKTSTSSKVNAPEKVRQCKICNKQCPNPSECTTFKSFNIKEKWEAVNQNRLCRKCLRCHNGYCRLTKECGIDGCVFKHHPVLHSERKKQNSETSVPKPISRETVAVVNNNFHHDSIPNILFRIIPVTLYSQNNSLNTFAYIDEGSSGTLMEEELANELNLTGHQERLCLLWTNNVHRIEEKSSRMDLVISGQNEFNIRYQMKGVRSVKDLGLPVQTINQEKLAKRFPYLSEIPLISYTNETPRILIGLPHARLCTQLTSIEGTEYQPIASKSRIGWSLHGPTREQFQQYSQHINEHRVTICEKSQRESDEELHRLVKQHFTLENFGVNINNEFNLESRENQRALEILKKNTKRVNGRFETSLLWRYDDFQLEDSYNMAKRRLICLEKSQRKFIPTINETINDYITKGYATKLTPKDLCVERSKVGYLPIFIVVSPKKPDKMRMVFDAAAKTKGTSLNDMLLKGPDQLSSLIDILRRFREHNVAICGDIDEMYPQIQICEEDRHVQRFLWRNGKSDQEPDIYVLNVMTFGAKCSPSSAQYVKNSNAEEFREVFPKAVNAIVSNTYVDDMMDGDETDEKVIQLVKEVQNVHKHAGFKIGKFLSNSPKVLEALGEQKKIEDKYVDLNPIQNLERVLGMFWNTSTDCFMFTLKYTKINDDVIACKRYPTKREILQTLMSIFDPLGLLQHYLVRLKILLQQVWRSKLQWDEELSTDEQKEYWDSWFRLLPNVESIAIPRLYSSNLSTSTVDLHIFVDASEDAYVAVAYLRIQNGQDVKCALVGSKTRVAPIKYVSIPRLELQAGVLGTRFMLSIEKSQKFKLNRRVIWTDSHTVISWLRSDHKKYQQFVAHRIGEILANSDQDMWRWLPGKENVADDATKWVKAPSFDMNSRWFNGPQFLYQPEENWPCEDKPIEGDTPEEMKIHCLYARLIPTRIVVPDRFSNWNRMVRALAYVFHYVKVLRAKIYKEKLPKNILSQDELIKSRNLILRQAQYEGYPDEMAILIRNQSLPPAKQRSIPKTSSLISFTPYLDENNVLRMRGRIDEAKDITFDQKRKIILPKWNRITSLLVRCYHQIYLHRNHETVINEMNQHYAIPQLRVMLKMVRKRCQYCKNLFARPQAPEMGNLPYARLAVGFRPFTYTGIDFFGPVKIVDGRTNKKRWGVLFTCLTTRAIHIEIAHTMDTDSCIMCIRNFIVDHGPAKEFYTDNGSNFVGADNELTEAVAQLDFDKIAQTYTTCYTEWKFNPPSAPHQGGVWERLVRSVKTSLYDILPDRKPTDEQLKNLLAEIQFVVNSRPLTFIPVDHDTDEALTPNHFIFGSSDGTKPILLPQDRPNLRSKWRENQRLADLFWKRFVKEYLPTLTRRTKWFEKVEPLKVGDLVLIMDTEGTRNSYPRAKVIQVFPGSNDQVRSAIVQRFDKSILKRPVHKLAKLDVAPSEEGLAVKPVNNQTGGSVTDGGFMDSRLVELTSATK